MSLHERVAASFVSRYFELLMTDAKQLASFYLPKAQFNHEGKTTSITGSEGIAKALARLYPVQNHGRVVIKEMKVQVTEQSAGRFAVTVGGTFYRRGATEGDEFRHVIELQEHQGSNGVYGICADTKKTIGRPVMSEWARETPPMFAKAGNEAAIPELVQPPATEPPACIPEPPAPAPSAKVETPKKSPTPPRSSPKLDAAAAPAPEEEVPAVSPVQEETSSTVAPSGGDAPRAERKSFADLVRAGAQKTAPASNPTRVEAKLADEGKGAKEETDKSTASAGTESGKKAAAAAAAKPSAAATASAAAASKPRKDGDAHDGAAKIADKTAKPAAVTTAAAAATGSADAPRRKDGPKISSNVIFYDVIVKGLPQDATEKSVHAMISPMAPVKKINVKSQPDKKDASITRTFAFVLFDHDSVVASGSTVTQTIQRVIKESRVKFGSQRIQVDEVREKFTQEDPRERDTS